MLFIVDHLREAEDPPLEILEVTPTVDHVGVLEVTRAVDRKRILEATLDREATRAADHIIEAEDPLPTLGLIRRVIT